MRLRHAAVSWAIAVVGCAAPLASCAALAAPASALEPGVFISPGSPAGKEYAMPLPTARGQALGRADNGSQHEPLFGVGIGTSGVGYGQPGSPAAGAARSQPRSAAGGSGREGGKVGGRSGQPARNSTASSGGGADEVSKQELASLTRHGSPAPQVALWGAVVLLAGLALGGLLAFVGRRRNS